MKLPVLLFAVAFTHTMVAMDDQATVNQPTTLRGVVERNPQGGYLEAEVTYKAGTYSGKKYNHGYSNQDFTSASLRPDDAQKYYQQLLRETLAAQAAAAQKK